MADLDDDVFDPFLDDEPILRPRRTGTRVVAAVLVIGLVILLILQPSGWLRHSPPTGPDQEEIAEDTTPSTVAALADHAGAALTDADWRLQEGSAVLVGVGGPRCSGAVTEIDGSRFVTSARHCLEDLLRDGVVSPEPGQAQEVTGLLSGTLHVFDPISHRRIASLDRIAVGTGDTDLLVATTRDETSTFRDKVARPITHLPAVGDEVATYASSGASGFRPQRLNGVYLGRHSFQDSDGHHYDVDLVGYRQASSSTLVSQGHSGHSPTGAGGTGFGPLMFSINGHTGADERAAELQQMSASTGLDLAQEGFVSVDESLHLDPGDYAAFAAALHI